MQIIPFTWAHTNLPALAVGDRVNLEFDMLGKYAVRVASLGGPRRADSVTAMTDHQDVPSSAPVLAATSGKQPGAGGTCALPRARDRRGRCAAIPDALDAIKAGRMVVVVDDGTARTRATSWRPRRSRRSRQLHGHTRPRADLPADTPERLDALEIALVVSEKATMRETAMSVSIDARGKTPHGHVRR